MLLQCPECDLQVSSTANFCPHCGFVFNGSTNKKHKIQKRLPNGFGRITKVKNHPKNPYRAMVTIGKNEKGKPIGRLLRPVAYFKTYNEAYDALVEYNKHPYDYYLDDVTVEELYYRWSSDYFNKISPMNVRNTAIIWQYCEPLYEMTSKSVKVRHLKNVINSLPESARIRCRVKDLLVSVFDYGVAYEIIERNPARAFNLSDDIIR